jgi:hypothetical protein
MRKFDKNDKYDVKDLEKLNAEKWQIDCLKLNPEYVWWGNYEDYMTDDSSQWASPVEIESVDDLWELDDLNEVVNFYFEIIRENHECPICKGTGLNAETRELDRSWYDFEETGKRWCDKINQKEIDTLWDAGRLHCDFKHKPTADEVNKLQKERHIHCAINRWICVETRAKSLGVYGYCNNNGCVEGYIYDSDKATLRLQMWVIHPRKGASRGVILKNIKKEDLPKVIKYLKDARKRNYDRFGKL